MVLIRHFSQAAYFLVAIGTFVIVLVTAHNPHQSDLLRRVTRENGIVEWGSVLVLCLIMLTTAQAIWAARKTDHPSKLKRNVLGVLFLTATLSALEEISWGQQIFGFRSSPFFLENNLQNHKLQGCDYS